MLCPVTLTLTLTGPGGLKDCGDL